MSSLATAKPAGKTMAKLMGVTSIRPDPEEAGHNISQTPTWSQLKPAQAHEEKKPKPKPPKPKPKPKKEEAKPEIAINIDFLKSFGFVLRLLGVFLPSFLWICIGTIAPLPSGAWFSAFSSVTGFILSLGSIVFHVYDVPNVVSKVPWTLIELLIQSLWSLFYAVSGIILAIDASGNNAAKALAAGAFFTFVLTIVHGLIAFNLIQLLMDERETNKDQEDTE